MRPLVQRVPPEMLEQGLLLETPQSMLLPAMPGMRCWDTAPVCLSPRMARRFLVFPEKGSFQRVEWVKTNCWLQHVRPIGSNPGTTGVDAGIPAKCKQTPPVARRSVIQWGAGGKGCCESEMPSVTFSDRDLEERQRAIHFIGK